MATTKPTPRDSARRFYPEELFFSTTDHRGIILSGNGVFRRVSGYSYEELIGQPHNIIRHPDVPRCIFAVLWQYITSGQTIAAYVKNMAKDGCHYWVVALVSPIERGYLSVRFKPTSNLLPIVESVYREILEVEHSLGAAGVSRPDMIAQTTQAIIAKINSLGFADYNAFMHAMLATELKSREETVAKSGKGGVRGSSRGHRGRASNLVGIITECGELHAQLDEQFKLVDSYIAFQQNLSERSTSLLDVCRTTRLLAMNAEIESARMGQSGMVLGVVAQRMGENAQESAAGIDAVAQPITTLAQHLREVIFFLSVSKLQIEMLSGFLDEVAEGLEAGSDMRSELSDIGMLLEALTASTGAVAPHFAPLSESIRAAADGVQRLERSRRTLEFIHSAGQVEAARTGDQSEFHVILQEVRRHVQRTKGVIRELQAGLSQVEESIVAADRTNGCVRQGLQDMERHVREVLARELAVSAQAAHLHPDPDLAIASA